MPASNSHAYRSLLNHLQSHSPLLPLETITSALAYNLAHSSPPTQLAASAVSAPLFLATSHECLNALHLAFRQAVHVKSITPPDSQDSKSSLFSSLVRLDARTRLSQWVNYVLQGLAGGAVLSRMMCYSGLICGIEDLRVFVHVKDHTSVVNSSLLSKVQAELVLAVAEVLDLYPLSSVGDPWESEFGIRTNAQDIPLTSISIASPALLLLPESKLSALPLNPLGSILNRCIESAFQSKALHPSQLLPAMPSISRLLARCATLLFSSPSSRPGGMQMSASCLSLLERLSPQFNFPLDSGKTNEEQKHICKTFLFTTLMFADGMLGGIIFIPPQSSKDNTTLKSGNLAFQTLRILINLSAVINDLGGVSPGAGAGVPELQRTFHYAVDIICAPQSNCLDDIPGFVTEICLRSIGPFHQINIVLNVIEFFIPTLLDSDTGRSLVQQRVWPLCEPYISSASPSRSTFELAHSVLLSIFSADAQHRLGDPKYTFPFARDLVPLYTRCLIDNAGEGGLSISQLCLAFSSLTQSVASNRTGSESNHWQPFKELLSALPQTDAETKHRLHLTFIHSVPNLSQPLMTKLLDHVEIFVREEGDPVKQDELVAGIADQILDKVGHLEKEDALRWWFDRIQSSTFIKEIRDKSLTSRL